MLGAGAVGGVLGSVVTGRVSRAIGIGPTAVLGCIVFTVPLILVPLAAGPSGSCWRVSSWPSSARVSA